MSINLPELTADVNAHQNLPHQPTMSANELKQAWDQPASDIKTYLNGLLIPQIQTQVGSEIASGVADAKSYTDTAVGGISQAAADISFDNTGTGMSSTNVQNAIGELKTGLSSTNTTAGKKTVYSDFAFSSHSANISLSAGGMITGTIAISKSGYYPLGIIGDADTQEDIFIRRRQITDRSNGSGKISYKVMNDDRGAPVSGTITFDVLWVKIR